MKVSLITAEQIKEKMLKGKIFAFIDTRPSGIFKLSDIAGSKNIPLETIETSKNILPSRTILLYDADPTRSFQAGVKLYDMGISNIYSCSDNYTTLKKVLLTNNTEKESTNNNQK
ncbi:MAG TPA: rhodanese-like domain-containing protein [Bacteroidales bacterium]|nr:rhodanese-like domain-containing protein [Bacteroidales bacterium]